MSNSRRASSPITRKKNVIRPLFTQPCRSWDTLTPPSRSDTGVPTPIRTRRASTFAQTSAAIVAASRTAALPVSVARNLLSGVWRLRPQAVRSALAVPAWALSSPPGRVPEDRQPAPRSLASGPAQPAPPAAMTTPVTRVTLDTGAAASRKLVVCSQVLALLANSEEFVPELSRQRRLLVLGVCCSSLFIVGLDATIVNIALPSIQRDLHAPVSGLQWTVDAYTLVVASFLILAGSTGDRVGRRRTFQVGLATFTLGSLLCSLAPGLGWLVAFRTMQAIGGSMLNPVALSIIANTFTDTRERARAHRHLGRGVRAQHGAGPGGRRRARRHRGVAGHLLGQHPGRDRGHRR